MFKLVRLRDTFRLPPADFEKPLQISLARQINESYVGRVIPDAGVGIVLDKIESVGEERTVQGDGGSHIESTFTYAVFSPRYGDLLPGRIISIGPRGIIVGMGFFADIFIPSAAFPQPAAFDAMSETWVHHFSGSALLIRAGDDIRFRVTGTRFQDPRSRKPAPPPDDPFDRAMVAPFIVFGSISGEGLGPISWWPIMEQTSYMAARIYDLCQEDKDKINSLVREVIALGRDRNNVVEQLASRTKEVEALTEETRIVREELKAAQELLQQLRQDLASARARAERAEASISSLTSENMLLRSRVADMESQLTTRTPVRMTQTAQTQVFRQDEQEPVPWPASTVSPTVVLDAPTLGDTLLATARLALPSASSALAEHIASRPRPNPYSSRATAAPATIENDASVLAARRVKQIQSSRLQTFTDAQGRLRGALVTDKSLPPLLSPGDRASMSSRDMDSSADTDSDLELIPQRPHSIVSTRPPREPSFYGDVGDESTVLEALQLADLLN